MSTEAQADENAGSGSGTRGWFTPRTPASEWLVVVLFVSSALLSAVAFWESTNFAGRAEVLGSQARFTESTDAQRFSAFQARVAHDRQLVVACETATLQRDDKLQSYSATFDNDSLAQVVEAEQVRIALEAQILAGLCAGYDVEYAADLHAFDVEDEYGFGRADLLDERAEGYSRDERLAVLATVAFAAALLVLTLADTITETLPFRVLMGLALSLLLVGLVLILMPSFRGRGELRSVVIVLATTACAMGLLAWGLTQPEAMPWRRRLGFGKPVRWWGELLGASALLLLTVAVYGFSSSSTEQRDAVSRADLLTLESRTAQELGLQSALAVLGVVQELATIDASAAGGLGQSPESNARPPQVTAALLNEVWPREKEAWEAILARQSEQLNVETTGESGTGDSVLGCLQETLILPWYSTWSPGDSSDEPLPQRLASGYRENRLTYGELITASTAGASVCSAQAAVMVEVGLAYGRQAANYTTAIVVLGLAGFLCALAVDPGHSPNPRHWLLAAAGVGFAAGVVILALSTWNIPDVESDQDIAAGAVAYANAGIAMDRLACDEARTLATEATTKLATFSPARVRLALAHVCHDSSDMALLISPGESGERLRHFTENLELVVDELGSQSSSAAANLAWAYMLTALDGDHDVDADAYLAQAESLTGLALQSDPSNHFICFNWALAALARGDDEAAETRYSHALSLLDGREPIGAECQPFGFDSPDLGTWMRMSALADLELLSDIDTYDRYRNHIVGRVLTDPMEVTRGDLRLVTARAEIGLESDLLADEDISVVWYYRESTGEPWSLLSLHTLETLSPGKHLGYYRGYGLLPDGEYRADIYLDGVVTHRVEEASESWRAESMDIRDFRLIQLPDLGLQVAIPRDWTRISSVSGRETVYGGDTGHVAFQRMDGSMSRGLNPTLDAWTERLLGEWGEPPLLDSESGLHSGEWYLDLEDTVTAEARPGLLRGALHDQYLKAGDHPLLTDEDVSGETCPGTTVATLISSSDADVAETVWLTQGLVTPPFTAQVHQIGLTERFDSPTFSTAIPQGWTAAGCPGNFAAYGVDGLANFLISSDPTEQPLETYVQTSIDEMQADFEQFQLLDRSELDLANGASAERISFTWSSEGFAVQQTQLFAHAEGSVFILTFTTAEDQAQDFAVEMEEVLGSFQVGGTEVSDVAASCATCDAGALAQRQAHLDEIVELIAVIDNQCRDTTDSAGGGALGQVSCDFPGGFSVSYTKWQDVTAMDTTTDRYGALSEAVVMEWSLVGDFDNPEGTTVEWVDSGIAWFHWTYDQPLVSGHASLSSGDQERLSNWWQTTGALKRE